MLSESSQCKARRKDSRLDLRDVGLKSIDVHNAILGDGRPLVQSNLLRGSWSRARLSEEGQKSEKSGDRKTHGEERFERGESNYKMKETSARGGCFYGTRHGRESGKEVLRGLREKIKEWSYKRGAVFLGRTEALEHRIAGECGGLRGASSKSPITSHTTYPTVICGRPPDVFRLFHFVSCIQSSGNVIPVCKERKKYASESKTIIVIIYNAKNVA